MKSSGFSRWWVFGLLAVFIVVYRLPVLVNAREVNSDAAVVGLQARHILGGEWSWFLWGASYQGALDALAAACAFAIFGAVPWVLALVPLVGDLFVTWLLFDVLSRRIGLARAGILSTLFVLTPMAVNFLLLYVAREACICLVFLSIWLLDRTTESRRPLGLYFAAGAAMGLAVYADLFALQFIPGLLLFALLCGFSPQRSGRTVAVHFVACLGTLAAGLSLLAALRAAAHVSSSQASISLHRLGPNLSLLWNRCLPWVLGTKVFQFAGSLYPALWNAPMAVRALQWMGAIAFALAFLGGAWSIGFRDLPWTLKRLGALGIVTSMISVAGFLLSSMPADIWSARYLAPLIWMAPFAIAPLAARMAPKALASALAPYFLTAGLGGYLSFGIFTSHGLPALADKEKEGEERRLRDALLARNIHYGYAQYWLSYRLTFLFGENPIVVPLNSGEDRYPPYREAAMRASPVSYIFHPSEPRARPEEFENWARARRINFEKFGVGRFTVFVVRSPR